jgi:hypothetical protein
MREWLYLIGAIFVLTVLFPKTLITIGVALWLL